MDNGTAFGFLILMLVVTAPASGPLPASAAFLGVFRQEFGEEQSPHRRHPYPLFTCTNDIPFRNRETATRAIIALTCRCTDENPVALSGLSSSLVENRQVQFFFWEPAG